MLIEDYKKYKARFITEYRLSPHKFILKDYIPPNDSTIKQYVDKIRKNHLRLHNLKCEDIEEVLMRVYKSGVINDADLKYIKRSMLYINQSLPEVLKDIFPNKNTLKSNLVPYVKLSRVLANYSEVYKKTYFLLQKYIVDLNENYEMIRDDNKVSEDDRPKIITDYSKQTLLANIEKLDDNLHKLIYAIYTMIPPRRLEYTNVELITISHKYKMNNDTNYIILKKRAPTQFIWNNYKTSDAYGRVAVDIPPELADIILDYIKENKIKTGMKLIDLQQSNFIRIIEMVFKKVYDVSAIGVRWLRIAFATHIDGMNISNNEKQKLTLAMGHSVMQSTKYRKVLDDET